MLVTKLTAIADAIRGKTGKTDGLTLDQMATEIAGIEAGGGGGGGMELIFETSFNVAASITSTSKTTLATIQTGLSDSNISERDFLAYTIECRNDTETDMSFSHFEKSFGTIVVLDGGYPNQSKSVTYFYRADTDVESIFGYGTQGVLISSTGQWVKSITVQAWGAGNAGGFAPPGNYVVKLYKINHSYFFEGDM